VTSMDSSRFQMQLISNWRRRPSDFDENHVGVDGWRAAHLPKSSSFWRRKV
jgi:hypothetical protein